MLKPPSLLGLQLIGQRIEGLNSKQCLLCALLPVFTSTAIQYLPLCPSSLAPSPTGKWRRESIAGPHTWYLHQQSGFQMLTKIPDTCGNDSLRVCGIMSHGLFTTNFLPFAMISCRQSQKRVPVLVWKLYNSVYCRLVSMLAHELSVMAPDILTSPQQ